MGELPRGFRFNPFEEELISDYLKPKVLGQELPSNAVEERQLYGPNANPWLVFHPENHPWILSEVSPGKFEKVTYVFVNLTKKSSSSSSGFNERKKKATKENYTKKAGCGTWDGQTKRSEIRDRITGDLIGEKRFLVFEINEVSGLDLSKLGYWKMHEFHLCGVNQDINNPNNLVLCKITLDFTKTPPVKLKNNPSKPLNNTSKIDHVNSVDANQGPISPGDHGNHIVQTCAPVECLTSDYGNDYATSPSEEINTGHHNPVSSQFSPPAKLDDQCHKNIKEHSGTENFLFGMTKGQFSGQDNSIEDITTNLGKRKIRAQTSCPMTKKLSPSL